MHASFVVGWIALGCHSNAFITKIRLTDSSRNKFSFWSALANENNRKMRSLSSTVAGVVGMIEPRMVGRVGPWMLLISMAIPRAACQYPSGSLQDQGTIVQATFQGSTKYSIRLELGAAGGGDCTTVDYCTIKSDYNCLAMIDAALEARDSTTYDVEVGYATNKPIGMSYDTSQTSSHAEFWNQNGSPDESTISSDMRPWCADKNYNDDGQGVSGTKYASTL